MIYKVASNSSSPLQGSRAIGCAGRESRGRCPPVPELTGAWGCGLALGWRSCGMEGREGPTLEPPSHPIPSYPIIYPVPPRDGEAPWAALGIGQDLQHPRVGAPWLMLPGPAGEVQAAMGLVASPTLLPPPLSRHLSSHRATASSGSLWARTDAWQLGGRKPRENARQRAEQESP